MPKDSTVTSQSLALHTLRARIAGVFSSAVFPKRTFPAWTRPELTTTRFLSTPLRTALILEDDVDFSLNLPLQITPTAHALRMLLSPGSPTSPNPSRTSFSNATSNSASASADPHFWAPPSAWDILWLGHCSDAASPAHILTHPSLSFPEPHTPPLSALSPSSPSTDLLYTFNLTKSRMIYRSYWPLCTFAYAVTRASARKILETYGSEGEGGCVAFDVRMLEACRDRGWRCWTVAPELFHHVGGRSEIAGVNHGEGEKGKQGGKEGGKDTGKARKPGKNIECGARSERLWVDGEDLEERERMLRWVREARGRGECFLDGKEGGEAAVES